MNGERTPQAQDSHLIARNQQKSLNRAQKKVQRAILKQLEALR